MKAVFILIAVWTGFDLSVCRAESLDAAFGTAAVISAGMPAVVSGIQGQTDSQINKVNAGAQMYMTDAVAKNSVTLASIAQGTSMYQTYMSVAATGISQAAATTRLGMQLASVEKISQMTMNLKQMQFAAELKLQEALLDLKQRALNAQVGLAESQQKYELTKAGLSLGNVPTDSGSDLAVSTTGIATNTPLSGDGASARGIASLPGQVETPSDKLLNSLAVSAPATSLVSQRSLEISPSVTPAGDSPAGDGAQGPSQMMALDGTRSIRTINAYGGANRASSEPASSGAVALPFQITQ